MLVEELLKVALLGSSWVMYTLLALSVLSIAAMVERGLFFLRRSDDIEELGARLVDLLERGDHPGAKELLKNSRSIEARILEPSLRYVSSSADAVTDAIEGQLISMREELERGSTLLGTLGNNAPFIGLFGTVLGVIIAFHQLGVSQASASMNAVMGGIAEALVATGVGLFVAIPAVVAFNVIQKRISAVENNVAAIAKNISALLKSNLAPPREADRARSAPPVPAPTTEARPLSLESANA